MAGRKGSRAAGTIRPSSRMAVAYGWRLLQPEEPKIVVGVILVRANHVAHQPLVKGLQGFTLELNTFLSLQISDHFDIFGE